MANTYLWGDVATLVAQRAGRDVMDNVAADACNMAQNIIWNEADWREALAELPPFWLIPGEQDHGAPAVTVPANFLGLRQCYCVSVLSGAMVRWPIHVQRDLQLTHTQDRPQLIEYASDASSFRLWPRVPLSYGATNYLIDGKYKKKPTKIVAQNLHNTLVPWDDLYYNVIFAALHWAFMVIDRNPAAGQVVTSGRRKQITGQLAVVSSFVRDMMEKEGVNLGSQAVAPASPLALGGSVWTGPPSMF